MSRIACTICGCFFDPEIEDCCLCDKCNVKADNKRLREAVQMVLSDWTIGMGGHNKGILERALINEPI